MNLFDYCKENDIEVNHACEVGFYRLEDSQIKGFIYAGVRCTVVDILQSRIAVRYKNVDWRRIGIDFNKGIQTFQWNGASTHKCGIASPSVQNKSQKKKHRGTRIHPVTTFDKIDDGTINVLAIDIEGMEWAVLKFLVSRPVLISVEMAWKKYKNPNFKKIRKWMRDNNYKKIATYLSDEIYRRTT